GGTAYGLLALSPSGNASVVNCGDVYVESTALKHYGAHGSLASSQGGTATIDNSGLVGLPGKYAYRLLASVYTVAVSAHAAGGALVVNSGDISAYSYAGMAVGALSRALYGQATADNSGDVYASSRYGSASGLIAHVDAAIATNSGTISAVGYYGGIGISAYG